MKTYKVLKEFIAWNGNFYDVGDEYCEPVGLGNSVIGKLEYYGFIEELK